MINIIGLIALLCTNVSSAVMITARSENVTLIAGICLIVSLAITCVCVLLLNYR